ncbi:uncharacterized protein CCOS01_15162 [Colletotrichum costaricense]|uniref:Uncharacterized protein n=1 Tax=Colletotrichum costaricense TaxID=1209916 RepID=A0AAI9YHT3_9PEZI|nr:uncharacterized protein CCOS01_15162 [Colletotrichum costaricense]KAK1510331.1 hypothetical protein CCOS01_15162 [Colletotrichum costaricense]
MHMQTAVAYGRGPPAVIEWRVGCMQLPSHRPDFSLNRLVAGKEM